METWRKVANDLAILDVRGEGTIDRKQFAEALGGIPGVTHDMIKRLLETYANSQDRMDSQDSDRIEYASFISWVFSDDEHGSPELDIIRRMPVEDQVRVKNALDVLTEVGIYKVPSVKSLRDLVQAIMPAEASGSSRSPAVSTTAPVGNQWGAVQPKGLTCSLTRTASYFEVAEKDAAAALQKQKRAAAAALMAGLENGKLAKIIDTMEEGPQPEVAIEENAPNAKPAGQQLQPSTGGTGEVSPVQALKGNTAEKVLVQASQKAPAQLHGPDNGRAIPLLLQQLSLAVQMLRMEVDRPEHSGTNINTQAKDVLERISTITSSITRSCPTVR